MFQLRVITTPDPRAQSADKIKAPYPLPHVSRRALVRVKERVEPPQSCRYCQGRVDLVSNAKIYGREYGSWPYVYLCSCCGASVGLHPDTDLPLGTLADESLRRARNDSKGAFIATYRAKRLDRNQAYDWLSQKTGIPRVECHFGMFDTQQCELVKAACD